MKNIKLFTSIVTVLLFITFISGCTKDKAPSPAKLQINNSVPVNNHSFNSCGTVTDYDGNVYNTVTIGTQCWIVENLRSTHYADGSPLEDGTGAGTITGNVTSKYFFNYNIRH